MQSQEGPEHSIRSSSQPRLILKRKLSKWQRDIPLLPPEEKGDFVEMELYPILENGELSQSYIEVMKDLNKSPLIHIGVWLPFEETMQFYRNMTGKQLQKSTLKTGSPFHFSHPHFEKAHNCHYIFWIGNYEGNVKAEKMSQGNKIFWKYPQIIVTNKTIEQNFNALQNIPDLQPLLNFKQTIIVYQPSLEGENEGQFQNFNEVSKLDKQSLHLFIFKSLKQNSSRTMNQSKKIYLYCLNLLLHEFSNQKDYLQRAVTSFINDDIEERYDKSIEKIKNSLPVDEDFLEEQLIYENEQIMKLLQQNISILGNNLQENEIIGETKRNIEAKNQKLFILNHDLASKKNQSIITGAYDRLMQNLKTDKIIPNFQNLSKDLFHFIEQIQTKSSKVDTLLHTFNHFMSENKKKYFQNVKKIFQMGSNNFQSVKKEQILENIQIKKGVLTTLQKQVKVLEQTRAEIEAENDRLKEKGEQLNSKVNFSKMRSNSFQLEDMMTDSLKKTRKVKDQVVENMKKSEPEEQKVEGKERICCCTIF